MRFENETRSGTKAEGLWMHPEYISRKNTDDRNLSFDIGLIRFQKTANRGFSSHYLPTFHNNLFYFTDFIQSIPLPTEHHLHLNNGNYIVTGYGSDDEALSSKLLSWIKMTVVSIVKVVSIEKVAY